MQNNDQMHPQDLRNLIIFAVLALTMWVAYDHFVAKPQSQEIRRAVQQAKIAAANAPSQIKDTAIVKPRPEIIAATPRVKIETPSLRGSINLKGGRLDDLQLKDYYKTIERKENVNLLSPARSPFPRYVETGWIGGKDAPALPDDDTMWKIEGANTTLTPSSPVTLTTSVAGLTYERTFTVDEDFGFSVTNTVRNTSVQSVTLYPYGLTTEHGLPEDFQNLGVIHEGPIAYIGDKLLERSYSRFKKTPDEVFQHASGWLGLTGKYWLTALAPADQTKETRFRFTASFAIDKNTKDRYQTDVTGPALDLSAGEEGTYKINVFSGPKKLKMLEHYEKAWGIPHFDLAVDFGWFYFLTKPFFIVLNWLYGLVGNFGIAIIIFTCFLRILIFPLANTSYKSFAKLRMVSPEMYNLRHEYKDDKQRLQQELVKLYQKHDVNPMAGCLPILVQIPVFFALYKVLSNTIEMRHAPFFGWIHDLSVMDPTNIFNLFGLIPWDPPSFMHIGAWPLLMMAAMIVQKNIAPPPEDPIQARLMAIMPYFMTFVMAKFAAGLVIYWTVSNTLAVIQQIIIMKSMGVPIYLFSKDKDKEKLEQEIEEGPVVHPSLEMIEDDIEEAVTGEHKPVTPPKPKKKKKK